MSSKEIVLVQVIVSSYLMLPFWNCGFCCCWGFWYCCGGPLGRFLSTVWIFLGFNLLLAHKVSFLYVISPYYFYNCLLTVFITLAHVLFEVGGIGGSVLTL